MKNKLIAKSIAFILACSFLVSLAGCTPIEDLLPSGKVTITISYSNEDATRETLVAIKERFPNIHIKLVNNSALSATGDSDYALLEYLSTHGGLADIILNSNLTKSLPSLTESFADLSGKSYTSRFKTSYLNDAEIDGAVYYLPFNLRVEGLVYNKTLFEEQGWKIPTNYEEFASLLQTIHNTTDIQPLYDEALYKTVSYWWNTYYALNEGSHLSGYKALKQFNDGEISATEMSTDNTFAYMKLLCDTGCLREEELSTFTGTLRSSPEAYRVLDARDAAMAFASSLTLKQVKMRGGTDEFAIIPLYTPDCNEGYLLEKQSINIGVSKVAAENPIKDAVIDEIMDYLTSKEGQEDILAYSYGIKSPCYGIMDADTRTYLDQVIPALNRGYLVIPRTFESLDDSMDNVFLNYLFHNENGELQPVDVLRAIDRCHQSSLAEQQTDSVILTTLTEDFTRDETKYLMTKAMADQAETDFAVLPNMQSSNYYGTHQRSESILTNLFAGTLSTANIRAIVYLDSPLKTYKITGEQLLKLLDYNSSDVMFYGAVPVYTYNKEKDTYYTTGAILPDGSELNWTKTYTLVASGHSELDEAISRTAVDTNLYLTDALIAYCNGLETLSPIVIPEPAYIE